MPSFKYLLESTKRISHPALEARRLYRWPKAAPYNFIDLPRKSPTEIQSDLRAWRDAHGSYSFNYFEYGADVEGRDVDTYLPYNTFKRLRDATNIMLRGSNDFNYICVTEDKLMFDMFARSVGAPVPDTIAVFRPDGFRLSGRGELLPWKALVSALQGRSGICKPAAGGEGAGIFRLSVHADEIYLDGEQAAPADLAGRIGTMYLFQELIEQHEDLARLNPTSVNTLRLITVRGPGGAYPLTAALRIGTGGGGVDNWAQGGIAVLVDVEEGRVRGRGMYKQGKPTVARHPDTLVDLDGYPLPHYRQCVEAACHLHDELYGFHSIGWDIAITAKGPVFIEGNCAWNGFLPLILDRAFLPKYLAALGTMAPSPYRHSHVRLINK